MAKKSVADTKPKEARKETSESNTGSKSKKPSKKKKQSKKSTVAELDLEKPRESKPGSEFTKSKKGNNKKNKKKETIPELDIEEPPKSKTARPSDSTKPNKKKKETDTGAGQLIEEPFESKEDNQFFTLPPRRWIAALPLFVDIQPGWNAAPLAKGERPKAAKRRPTIVTDYRGLQKVKGKSKTQSVAAAPAELVEKGAAEHGGAASTTKFGQRNLSQGEDDNAESAENEGERKQQPITDKIKVIRNKSIASKLVRLASVKKPLFVDRRPGWNAPLNEAKTTEPAEKKKQKADIEDKAVKEEVKEDVKEEVKGKARREEQGEDIKNADGDTKSQKQRKPSTS